MQFAPPEGMRVGQLGHADRRGGQRRRRDRDDRRPRRARLPQDHRDPQGGATSASRTGTSRSSCPAPTAELLPYEMSLMQAIFKGRNEVLLSDLKNTFASDLKATQNRLYDDVTARGWFRGNPQTVRQKWGWAGLAAIVVGVGGELARLQPAEPEHRHPRLRPDPRRPGRALDGQADARADRRRDRQLWLRPTVSGVSRDRRGRADQVRGGAGHLQPLPALRHRLRRGRAVGQGLRAAGRLRRQRRRRRTGTSGYWVGSAFNFGGFGSAMDSFSTVASGALCRRRRRPGRAASPAAVASPVAAAAAVAAAPGSRSGRLGAACPETIRPHTPLSASTSCWTSSGRATRWSSSRVGQSGGVQSSPVTAGVDAQGRIVISSYPERAKVTNARRDPESACWC